MRIELAGWESVGMRCPDVAVDLRRKTGVPAVTLLQMPNGTGKTTTLELLNATLSGGATGWSADRVRSYRRSGDQRSEGSFKATLLVDQRPLTVELQLSYEDGKASYLTTNPGSGGVVRRWHVPPSLNRFLTPEFLSLFIFDGEFAGRLLDGNRAEADRVVDALCQLYMLDELSLFAEQHWERAAKAHSTKTETGLGWLVAARDRLVARRKEVTVALEAAKSEIGDLEGSLRELRENIDARLSSVESTRERHEQAERERLGAANEVRAGRSALMSALRMPHAVHPSLATQLTSLRDNLDKLRLPENTSAQFFEELVSEDECICGRPMDASSIQEIKARASRYLDADDAGVLNALKKDIERYAGSEASEEEEGDHARIQRLCDELTGAVRKERRAEQQVRVLMGQLIDAGDRQLDEWQRQHQIGAERLTELTDIVDSIEGPGEADETDEKTMSLSLIGRRLKEKNDQIAEIRGTVHLRRQTEMIKDLLGTAVDRARSGIKAELVEECNQRLSMILANDPLRIDRIDRSIRLRGQEGASAGQTLSIGYTFLMSVLNRGQNDFPLVVDSPAGPIDEGVRRRIGRLLPKLCTQFVGFTINTERVGFVDALEANVDDISFLTLFRKTPGTQRLLETLPSGGYEETETAVLVEDRDYFFRFDIEEENDNAV